MDEQRASRVRERGQASVELLATMPFLLLAGLAVWQLALAGHAAWLAANAARVAARARTVGGDPGLAARSALPARLERGLRVRRNGRLVEVRVRVPLVVPGRTAPVSVGASASLEPAA